MSKVLMFYTVQKGKKREYDLIIFLKVYRRLRLS